MQALKNAQNPQALLNQMAQSNPQVKFVMDYIKNNGNDPKTAFYNMAREKGIDPDQILSQLK